jgi:putative membrane protein insertion efficiency factor
MLKRFLIRSIEGYQDTLSPLLRDRGVQCIFEQSCSRYAIVVVQRSSTPVACVLICFRILSCNPVNAVFKRQTLKDNKIIYGEGI